MLGIRRPQLPKIAPTYRAQGIERDTCLDSTYSQITAPIWSDVKRRFPPGQWTAARMIATSEAQRTSVSGRLKWCCAIELVAVKAASESVENPSLDAALHESHSQDGAFVRQIGQGH